MSNRSTFTNLLIMTGVWLVVGAVLLFIRLPLADPASLQMTIPIVLWPRVLGIVIISAMLGNLLFSCITIWLVKWIGLNVDPASSFKSSWLLAICEIILYSLSLAAGVEELVAVWLAFKAVSVWTGHTGETTEEDMFLSKRFEARNRYSLFLFNNALRLGWAALTYVAIFILI